MGLSREACGRIGKHRVYLDHLRAVASLAAARGKSLQFWADIVLEAPELVAELPAGVTGLVWGYEASHPFATQCPAFARAAVPYIVCPGTSCWNSIAGRWLNAQANIASATANACAAVLKRAGASCVAVLTLARADRRVFDPVAEPVLLVGGEG